jgi:cell division protein FtsZ
MGTGSATGTGRAIKAATEAISSPLLEDISINGATGIIINITGSDTLTMHETNEAVTLIMEAADENAEIIFGTVIDNNCGEDIKVTVIATGLGGQIRASAGATMASSLSQTTSVASQPTIMQSQVAYVAPTPVSAAPIAPTTPVVSQPVPVFTQPIETPVASREIMREEAPVSDRSDFDRFMSDRNAYNTHTASNISFEEEATAIQQAQAQQAPQQPSRLIQSIRDAANRYENANSRPQTSPAQAPRAEAEMSGSAARAKSIAEKLGFINFDEDEFDTPSYLRKEEKVEPKVAPRDFKNFDL